MSEQRVRELQEFCAQMRVELVELLHGIQTGHPGGSLSCTEIVALLYQEKMNIDPSNPAMPERDRFVMSKGHACPMLYLNMAHRGFFPLEEMKTLRQIGSRLQGHPCAHKLPGIEVSTGPLGLGLSAALGISLAGRLQKLDYTTYVLLGDGEIQEGGVWEAAMSAVKFKANKLVAILDNNHVQLDGTNDEIMPMGDVRAKWEAFGWKTYSCSGHDIRALSDALDEAKAYEGGPAIIIAETVKGKGVSFMEGKSGWHGKAIGDADFENAMTELGGAQK
ncbi:MAG: transketolase [Candidatus Heteroscillospira sp.]